jgi:hypothetical protein
MTILDGEFLDLPKPFDESKRIQTPDFRVVDSQHPQSVILAETNGVDILDRIIGQVDMLQANKFLEQTHGLLSSD